MQFIRVKNFLVQTVVGRILVTKVYFLGFLVERKLKWVDEIKEYKDNG